MSTTAVDTALAVRKYVIDHRREIEIALPRHLNIERFIRVSFTVLSQNPKLYACERRSLLGALVQVAQLGLEPGVIGQAFLVPFNDRKRQVQVVQLIPGYKGLLELARRSGQISTFHAWPVYEGDHYRVVLGTEPKIEHVPSDKPIAWVEDVGKGDKRWRRRPMVAVYAVARMKDGAVQFDSMRRDECEWHRDRFSRAAGDGPWVTDFEEMSKKTVLRRLAKLLPASVELQTAVALDEMAEVGVAQDLGHLIDMTPDPDPPAPPTTTSKLDTLVRAWPMVTVGTAGVPEAPEAPEAPPERTEPEGPASDEAHQPRSEPAVSETALALRRSVILKQRDKLGLSNDEFEAVCQTSAKQSFAAITDGSALARVQGALARIIEQRTRRSTRRTPDGVA